MKTIRYGVVGIHGFSRDHIRHLQTLMRQKEPASLAAAVAHARHLDEAFAADLEKTGVKLVPDLEALLAMKTELDVITLPVGIHLHVPMALQALNAGCHVYLEKPLAGAIQDGLALAAAAARAKGRLFIGYQDMYQPASCALKRELLAREFGTLRKIVVMAAWPRTFNYYARNNWAGKLAINGTWVLDSPVNNACAHYLNLALFWAGSSEPVSARPVSVTAELARANRIESADTTCLRATTADGVEIVFAASHACHQEKGPLFRLECDKGFITTQRGSQGHFIWTVHRPGRDPETRGGNLPPVISFGSVARVLNGESLPVGTLDQALEQTRTVNGAFLSSPIRTVPDALCAEEAIGPGDRLRVVQDMNAILDLCFEKGCLPSETGLAPWSIPGKPVEVRNLREFKPEP
jgi:predicted dehydrogenase